MSQVIDKERRISGGKASREKISQLCELGSPWRLESIKSHGERLRLGVASNGTKATVVLKPSPTDGYFIRSGQIDICYEGKEAGPELVRLLEDLGKRLKTASIKGFLHILESDPESVREEPIQLAEDGLAPDAQGVTDRLGGNPGQWRRFFCHPEFERKFHWAHPTGFSGRILYFVHGDFDCTFMPPDVMYRGMNFINYPPLHPHSPNSPVPSTAYEQWSTDLHSKDIILGTRTKLDSFLDSIRTRAKPDDLVMISWSCVPTIIGDDEEAMAKACRDASTAPVLINSIRYRMQKGTFSLFEDLFTEVKKREDFKATKSDPNAVNIFDCQPRFSSEELVPFLKEIGIRINTSIFPVINVKALRGYLSAASSVLPIYLKKKESVVRALSDLPVKTVYAPAPYGIAGTQDFVMALAKSVNKEKEAFETWASRWDGLRPQWEALCQRASKKRLAFVADEMTIKVLLREGFVAGIPVLAAVGEMGFGIDFLIYAPGGKLPESADLLTSTSWFKTTPKVHSYRNNKELTEMLETGDFSAVYSDIFFDFRLTTAGKPQFSMRTFEAGVEGAIRTLKRLLEICEFPFYRKYKRYLKKVSRGQDV